MIISIKNSVPTVIGDYIEETRDIEQKKRRIFLDVDFAALVEVSYAYNGDMLIQVRIDRT